MIADASVPRPLYQRISQRPFFAMGALLGAVILALAGWIVLGSRAPTGNLQTHWYGDAFAARGFEKQTIGRALLLPTREQGTQRVPAISVLENIAIPSAQYPSAGLALIERDAGHRIALIWRNSVSPVTTQRLELEASSDANPLIQLSSHPGWQGTITGLGVVAGHPNAARLMVAKLELHPNTSVHRFQRLVGDTQIALSRPVPGQESVARAVRVWPLGWIVAACALVSLGLAWLSLGRSEASFTWQVALGTAVALVLTAYLVRAMTGLDASADASELTRRSTLSAINTALQDTSKPATMVHVWSGDGRGHEVALALAPKRTQVRLSAQSLPPSSALRPNDVIVMLARRGVRFSPTAGTVEWEAGDGILQRARAEFLYAGSGDALLRIRP